MIKWNSLSKNEKVMIGLFIVLVLAIALRWKPIWDGFKKGIEPYNKELNATTNNRNLK